MRFNYQSILAITALCCAPLPALAQARAQSGRRTLKRANPPAAQVVPTPVG